MASQRPTMDTINMNNPIEYKSHPPPKFEEAAVSPPAFTSNERANLAFTKTAFVFKDILNQIRGSDAHVGSKTASLPAQSVKQPPIKIEEFIDPAPAQNTLSTAPPIDPRIRILRVVQHALLSSTSVVIAVLQSLTYIKYEQTKNVPDAWPQHPTLGPTLLLLAVALMALLFDFCSLVAYIFPTKPIADKAYRLAIKLHYWITSLKTFAYTIAAAVCRAGFSMGGNQDLWGWSCSSQGQALAATNDAHVNCTGNTVAWLLSLLNISVEVIGILITQLMEKNKNQTTTSDSKHGSSPNPASENSASSPLLVKYNDLEALGDNVQNQLKNPSPAAKP